MPSFKLLFDVLDALDGHAAVTNDDVLQLLPNVYVVDSIIFYKKETAGERCVLGHELTMC